MPINVVLADDHPVVFEGISKSCGPEFQINGPLKDVSEITQLIDDTPPDVLVAEIRLNGQDVLKTIEAIRERNEGLKIVVYSAWDNPTYIARAAAIGVKDFVLKTSPVHKLFRAIQSVHLGEEPPVDSLIVTTQSKMRRPRQNHDFDVPLTNREMQVLRHISMGLSNREIGKSLGISVETVKEHVQNILRKLNVNDRTQAAVWAVKRGVV